MTRDDTTPLIAVAGITILETALLIGVPSLLGTVGRLLLGVPLVLVFPGYVVFHLVFQGGNRDGLFSVENPTHFQFENWSTPEIIAISVGISIAIVPILVRVTMATLGYTDRNVVLTLAAFVLVGTVVGLSQRDGTFGSIGSFPRVSIRSIPARLGAYFERDTKFGLITSVVLIVSVLFFLSTVAFAFSGTPTGEASTEFYLLTENESGDLVASGYPTTMPENGTIDLAAGIENHEHETTTYTLVVEEQLVRNGTVRQDRELYRSQRTVDDGQTATIRHSVDPQTRDQRVRLQYYLYRGDAPDDPTTDDAYETVHLDISPPEE